MNITIDSRNWMRMLPFLLDPVNRHIILGLATRSQDDEEDELTVMLADVEVSGNLRVFGPSDADPFAFGGYWLTPKGTLLAFTEGYGDDEFNDLKLYRVSDAEQFEPDPSWVNWPTVCDANCIAEPDSDVEPAEKLVMCAQFYGWENFDPYPLVIAGARGCGADDEARIRCEVIGLLNLQVK